MSKIPPLKFLHILQKDSKNVFQIDIVAKTTKVFKAKTPVAFPHNFQLVNGPLGQLFMIGGGDYQKDDDTLYNMHQVQTENGFTLVKRDSMKHPRHGHSATWFGEKFVVVTGSRKEKNSSEVKCEMYNSDIDLWFEMPDLTVGRHYHSSCQFMDRFLYVFCGIANKTRKYINSIEVYDHQKKTNWRVIDMNAKLFPDRQGCGAYQKDETNILIFGGFSGRFLKDSFLFNV